jgi:hypothetical protein
MNREQATSAPPRASGALEELGLVTMERVTGGFIGGGNGAPEQAGAQPPPQQSPASIINSIMGVVNSLSSLAGSGGQG